MKRKRHPPASPSKVVFGTWTKAAHEAKFLRRRFPADYKQHDLSPYYSHHFGGYVLGTRDKLLRRLRHERRSA